MCGIVGVATRYGLSYSVSQLESCRDTLVHRGPDSAGQYCDGQTFLGFRRLSILDLDARSNQPMASDSRRVWLLFNGEIYNYLELKNELAQEGYCLKTTSDTEVILNLYLAHGMKMLERLNGMFALAIYDIDKDELLLARDRLGKKPLFYWYNGSQLAFASELKALRCLPDFPTTLDPTAIGLYFRLGWVPGWTCVHPHVQKLPPATWLKFRLSSGELRGPYRYWDLPNEEYDYSLSVEGWTDRIEQVFWDAVRIRLRSDVPLGVFLSGGIDSSLVAAAASKLMIGRLTTLTVGFPGWLQNEWPIAEKTAHYLGVDAKHEELPQGSFLQLLPYLAHFDEPFADSSALPMSLVCQAARQRQLTVILSGDGGDEVFAGYLNHLRAWQWRHIGLVQSPWQSAVVDKVSQYFTDDSRIKRTLKRAKHLTGWLGIGGKLYPFDDWTQDLLRPDVALSDSFVTQMFEQHANQPRARAPIDIAQRTDLQLYLVDDVLTKVDRMSMLHSLEVRSPFLDYRLVEAALRIPPHLRTYQRTNKYLLRRVAARHLPPQVTQAPKRGFGIPLRTWLFTSEHTSNLKAICIERSSRDDVISAKNAAKLWAMAERNDALTAALLRVIAYKVWYAAIIQPH